MKQKLFIFIEFWGRGFEPIQAIASCENGRRHDFATIEKPPARYFKPAFLKSTSGLPFFSLAFGPCRIILQGNYQEVKVFFVASVDFTSPNYALGRGWLLHLLLMIKVYHKIIKIARIFFRNFRRNTSKPAPSEDGALLSEGQENDGNGGDDDRRKSDASEPHSKLISAPLRTLISDLLFGIGLSRTPIGAQALNGFVDVIGLVMISLCDFVIALFADNEVWFAVVCFDKSRMAHPAGWNSSSQCTPFFLQDDFIISFFLKKSIPFLKIFRRNTSKCWSRSSS